MKLKECYWRYQVINRGTQKEPLFGVHEIIFNIKREGDKSWTQEPITLDNYENIEDLINSLEMMLNDVKKFAPLLESELEKDS